MSDPKNDSASTRIEAMPHDQPVKQQSTATGATRQEAFLRSLPMAESIESRVLNFIEGREAFGATDDEAEAALGIRAQSLTPRRLALQNRKLVVASELRRKTRSGRWAIVWVVPAFAPKQAGDGPSLFGGGE